MAGNSRMSKLLARIKVLGIEKSMEGTNCHGRLNGLYTDEAVSCHKCVTIPSLSITSMSEQKD
ncbi:hypothetical protein GBA52_015395 [Prunus armeniaca]|nr:hypothetical protein GBA52_015395 [Prunus armeniaca]